MKLYTRLAAILFAFVLASSVLANAPGEQSANVAPSLTVDSVQCDDFMDIIQMHNGTTEWLVNEKQPLDGYSLYSSKFFPSYLAMWQYTSAVKYEFRVCDWYADADAAA